MPAIHIFGNWKMNLDLPSAMDLARGIADSTIPDRVVVGVFPPPPYLAPIVDVAGIAYSVGGQVCHAEAGGAHTGEIAAGMIASTGGQWVLCGHSERRAAGESDEEVGRRVKAAIQADVRPVLCIGETLKERKAGQLEEVLDRQLEAGFSLITDDERDQVLIAYEPVWAIGTGEVASPEQAQEAHAYIRNWLRSRGRADLARECPILYGGSVKPENAAGLMAQEDIDGALVGGASLKIDSFLGIIQAVTP